MSEDYRIEHYYSLAAEEFEEGTIFCTPAEAEHIRAALEAALPDVEVTMEGGAEYDYSTENATAAEVAAAILAHTGFVSPAVPL